MGASNAQELEFDNALRALLVTLTEDTLRKRDEHHGATLIWEDMRTAVIAALRVTGCREHGAHGFRSGIDHLSEPDQVRTLLERLRRVVEAFGSYSRREAIDALMPLLQLINRNRAFRQSAELRGYPFDSFDTIYEMVLGLLKKADQEAADSRPLEDEDFSGITYME